MGSIYSITGYARPLENKAEPLTVLSNERIRTTDFFMEYLISPSHILKLNSMDVHEMVLIFVIKINREGGGKG